MGVGVSTGHAPQSPHNPPHLLQCILMQLVQVEGVDAFLSPHHQELVCGLGLGSGVGRLTPHPPTPRSVPNALPFRVPRVTGWIQVTAA